MTTFASTTSQCALAPAATAAPTSPPMSACEELEGRPKYQVVRFQAIAPISPAITITRAWVPTPGADRVGDVWATFCPRKAPTKFMTAAMRSATLGVRARVETDVAMALAASWKPLV